MVQAENVYLTVLRHIMVVKKISTGGERADLFALKLAGGRSRFQCGLTSDCQPSSVICMECLHAPWRIQYILALKSAPAGASLFARIAQDNDDVTHYVVARQKTCFAVLNAYPYNGGHLLVVPYKQTADLNDLTDDELLDLMKLTRRCQNALTRLMKPDGFNIGINLGKVAGAGVAEHLHIHVVPRWNGDTNFMPVLAGTTVLPQALSDLAAQLRAILIEPAQN